MILLLTSWIGVLSEHIMGKREIKTELKSKLPLFASKSLVYQEL